MSSNNKHILIIFVSLSLSMKTILFLSVFLINSFQFSAFSQAKYLLSNNEAVGLGTGIDVSGDYTYVGFGLNYNSSKRITEIMTSVQFTESIHIVSLGLQFNLIILKVFNISPHIGLSEAVYTAETNNHEKYHISAEIFSYGLEFSGNIKLNDAFKIVPIASLDRAHITSTNLINDYVNTDFLLSFGMGISYYINTNNVVAIEFSTSDVKTGDSFGISLYYLFL